MTTQPAPTNADLIADIQATLDAVRATLAARQPGPRAFKADAPRAKSYGPGRFAHRSHRHHSSLFSLERE